MRKLLTIAGFILALILALACGPNPEVKRGTWPVQVQDCHRSNVCDIYVTQWGEEAGRITVRIKGIATPQPYDTAKCDQERELGQIAKDLLNELLAWDKEIWVHELQKDVGFLYKARIEVEGKDVGQVLIDKKLAVP